MGYQENKLRTGINWAQKSKPGSEAASPMNPAITRTVKVALRHSSKFKDKSKGAEWRKCRCSKTLLVYESDKGKNRRISAKTRLWERAVFLPQRPLLCSGAKLPRISTPHLPSIEFA